MSLSVEPTELRSAIEDHPLNVTNYGFKAEDIAALLDGSTSAKQRLFWRYAVSEAMSNRFRVSSTLPRKLKELGLSPDTVLRRAGLPIGLFKLDRILVSTEQFFALHRGIAGASNDPAIGLRLGTEERVERYDPVKLAALSARSFRISHATRTGMNGEVDAPGGSNKRPAS